MRLLPNDGSGPSEELMAALDEVVRLQNEVNRMRSGQEKVGRVLRELAHLIADELRVSNDIGPRRAKGLLSAALDKVNAARSANAALRGEEASRE